VRVGEINPATIEHIERMQHYNRLMAEKRIIDNLQDIRKRDEARRVQETGKGQHVDVMV
jgi:hypothetical protein